MNGLIYLVLRQGIAGGIIVENDKVTKAFPYAMKRGWRPGRNAHDVWLELADLRETQELRWMPDTIQSQQEPCTLPCHK